METNETTEKTGQATYCPEDNKLRLYVGRVPRDEYLKLRADGWTSTPKQGCDFVAPWTPGRCRTCLAYADIIEDEDMNPEERAADRAERFGGYRDKRFSEATGHADHYESGPSAHGYQSQARAERMAARHDRMGTRAVDSWSKAEYWQRRTDGVISHALYKSTPSVRMGRIKTIEAELRGIEKQREENASRFETWRKISAMTDPDQQTKLAESFSGIGYGRDGYKHPRTGKAGSLWDFLREDATDRLTGAEAAALYLASHTDPLTPAFNETRLAELADHCKLRLAYENQMLEAQGGRAAFVEMEVGGWIGSRQIRKVNKSPATGRVVSVTLKIKGDRYGNSETGFHLRAFNIERLPEDAYRAPSDDDKAALASEKAVEKAAAPVKAPCPLINPTDEDAQRLQDLINARAKASHDARKTYATGDFVPVEVCKVPQAVYSANSKGSFARAETRGLCRGGELENRESNMYSSERAERAKRLGLPVCQIRITGYSPVRVVVITDKPQKPLPAQVWEVLAEPVTA